MFCEQVSGSSEPIQFVTDHEQAWGGDGGADSQAAVAIAVDGAQNVEVLLDRPVDALGLRPGDHDAAFDPLADVQLGVAEAHLGADERVLAVTIQDDVGAEAPPRPARNGRQRQQRDIGLPAVVECPGGAV